MAGFNNDVVFAQAGMRIGDITITTGEEGSIQFSQAGADVALLIKNTSNAAGSQAIQRISVGGAAASDPFINFQVDGVKDWAAGINNSSSDNFQFTPNSDLSFSPLVEFADNGINIIPLIGGTGNANIFINGDIGNDFVEILNQNTNAGTSADSNFVATVVAGGGDALFKANATGVASTWIWGLDNSDSDKWKLGGANDNFASAVAMEVELTGEVNFPLTPCFLASVNSSILNVTGDGTQYTVIFESEKFDQGSDYNITTGVFTAPVTGRYALQVNLEMFGIVVGMTQGNLVLRTSNREYRFTFNNPGVVITPGTDFIFNGSATCDMDASDTALVVIEISNDALVADVRGGGATDALTFFSGQLAC